MQEEAGKWGLWVFIPNGLRQDGLSGWVRTGIYSSQEEAEGVLDFAQKHNPFTHYEIRLKEIVNDQ